MSIVSDLHHKDKWSVEDHKQYRSSIAKAQRKLPLKKGTRKHGLICEFVGGENIAKTFGSVPEMIKYGLGK